MTFPSGIVEALGPARLRLLIEVGRRGSISAAAAVCEFSQPSATKQLQALEAALGERLVEREGRGSRLTEAGQLVADHGIRMLDTLEAMQEDLRALAGAAAGTLALAASTTPGTYLLPSLLKAFRREHPRVEVEVVIGSSAWVAERVHRREVSLALAGEVELPAGVAAMPVLEDELVGIAAPDQLEGRDGNLSLDDLQTQTVLVREPGSSTRAVAERYLTAVGYRPAKQWELASNEAIKRSVQSGLGIGFLSRLVVEDELGRGDLTAFRVAKAAPMRRSIYLLRPVGRRPTSAEAAFIEALPGDSLGGTPRVGIDAA